MEKEREKRKKIRNGLRTKKKETMTQRIARKIVSVRTKQPTKQGPAGQRWVLGCIKHIKHFQHIKHFKQI